jgi:hypothetical protein
MKKAPQNYLRGFFLFELLSGYVHLGRESDHVRRQHQQLLALLASRIQLLLL